MIIIEKVLIDKALLNIDEFCAYLGIGKTKARELLHTPKNGFTIKIGNRLYAHKELLDDYLIRKAKYTL